LSPVVPPADFIPQNECPKALTPEFIAMMRLNATACAEAVERCKKVLEEVKEGIIFQIPIYAPSTYSSVMAYTIPANVTVSPPSKLQAVFTSSAHDTFLYSATLIATLSIFL
jgi:hypothetical protein